MRLKPDVDSFVCDFCQTVYIPQANEDGVRVLDESASLACPVCRASLVHAAIAGTRILYCRACRGMLIGMDRFVGLIQDLRSNRDTPAATLPPPDPKDLQRRINCPRCGNRMDTHPYGGPGNVIIDDCEHCQVNWLDYGELQRIVRAPDHHYSGE
jgi:Zn-finger nucleic acid-binding protein